MDTERYAAIDLDEIGHRPLGELSAVEFLQILNHPTLSVSHRYVLADKKKYELWIDETPILKVSVKEILGKLRGEKKKLELEVPPWMKISPEDGIREVEYGTVVEDIADRMAHAAR